MKNNPVLLAQADLMEIIAARWEYDIFLGFI
jgi:hypothetical protein